MSSQYPVLNNRPIDQWKVTELKEELRKRKLVTKGLKEDLVKRLCEAIHNEMEFINEELGNGFKPNSDPLVNCEDSELKPIDSQVVENIPGYAVNESEKVDNEDDAAAAIIDFDSNTASVESAEEEQVQEGKSMSGTDTHSVVESTAILTVSIENGVTDRQCVETQLDPSAQETKCNIQVESEVSKRPSLEDVKSNVSDPNNQVSEVSRVLAFQVNCESISTDSVSITEKNELKDNLNADNLHLEIKPEMVEPSSGDVPTIGGDLHSLGDQEPGENEGSMAEINDTNAATADLRKKNDSADAGSSEKLNFDRSSGDDSLEEDVLDSKQIDSMNNSDEAVDRSEPIESHVVKEGSPVVAMEVGLSPGERDVHAEKNHDMEISSEKRKLKDQEPVEDNEPSKRQRRWNSETIKVPEPQTTNLIPSSTPQVAFQSTPRRAFTRSYSILSEDAPKERAVPPSQKTPTTSLRIDRFLRPFTLRAVQELLAKTGTVTDFWMDHIKTHCYVTFSLVEEAIATRNALYNLQWPPNGGRLLIAEFVDPQEMKTHIEAPPQIPVQPQPASRQHDLRQQLLPPPTPPLSDTTPARERLPLPSPPPKKPDPPIVTLDDLFRKTRATPRIYYLPLSEEQVAAKLGAQSGNTK